MQRKYMDIVSVQEKLNSKKIKKWPGVRRRLVMKYKARLNPIEVPILFGKSQIIDASNVS